MSPPELPADAPVTDIFHPVIVDFAEPVGNEFCFSFLHCGDGRLCQGLHLHEPLLAQSGFHRRVLVTIAEADIMAVIFDFHQKPELLQFFHNSLPAFHRIHAGKASGVLVHGTVVVGNGDDLKVVPLGNFEVVRIMGRRHLHGAGSKIHFHIFVSHDGNFLVHNGQNHFFTHQFRIALIRRIYSHAGIAQHGFRTGCCNNHAFAAVGAGITDMPQMAGLLFVNNFSVTQSAAACGTPVDHPLSAIDHALFKQAYEDFAHGLAASFIHGETFP